jgi:hypothetical protein
MVVSLNYSLIPSPAAHYPIQPYVSENPVEGSDSRQKPIERHSRLRQPHAGIMTGGFHYNDNGPRSRYDNRLRLQFSDADQVGRLVDIYA